MLSLSHTLLRVCSCVNKPAVLTQVDWKKEDDDPHMLEHEAGRRVLTHKLLQRLIADAHLPLTICPEDVNNGPTVRFYDKPRVRFCGS